MNVIPGDLQALYDYEIEDSEDRIALVLRIPPVFNVKSLSVDYDAESNSLKVHAPGIPPVCSGELFEKVDAKYETEVNESRMRVTFAKAEKGDWPVLIQNSNETHPFDPKSAFLMYVVFEEQGDLDEDKAVATQMLEYSASLGYVDAIRHLADRLLVTEGKRKQGLELLQKAASVYHDPLSFYKLGLIFAYSENSQDAGFVYLQQAAQLGCTQAYAVLGKMLSPLAEWKGFQRKNAAEAIQCFARAQQNAQALHEWAKLVMNGVGCKKDAELANKLQSQAKGLDPDIPDLPAEAESQGSNKWLIASVAVGAASVLGLAFFRQIRKFR